MGSSFEIIMGYDVFSFDSELVLHRLYPLLFRREVPNLPGVPKIGLLKPSLSGRDEWTCPKSLGDLIRGTGPTEPGVTKEFMSRDEHRRYGWLSPGLSFRTEVLSDLESGRKRARRLHADHADRDWDGRISKGSDRRMGV